MIKILNSKFVKVAALLVAVFAVVAVVAPSAVDAATCTFTRALTLNVSGSDVMCLQQYLNSAGFTVSATGAGSPGNESMYFGTKTRAAVSAWQAANGISPTAGYFGSLSRAKYDALMAMGGTVTPTTGTLPAGCTSTTGFSPLTGVSCGSGTVTPVTGGGLTVTAGTQPANSLAPEGAARVPFTTFTLTAGASAVHVNSVVVQRSGLAQDAVFAGLVLVGQDGIQIGTAKTLGSTHQAILDANFDIPAGQSRTFTVAGNMSTSLDSYAGQVASIMVVGVNTSATVGGTLPITGAAHTINMSLSIGNYTAQSSTFDPQTSQTKEIGTTGLRFSGVRMTAGSAEDVRLWSIRWYQSGSAGASDVANLVTVINGTEYPTVMSSDGKYYTSTFGNGIVITKGNAIDAYIKGDIIGSSGVNRTIIFDVYKTTDVYMTGETYGYGVTLSSSIPSPCATATTDNTEFVYSNCSSGTASTPWFSGSKVTINGGSATSVSKANSVASQNIALNVPNQVLGGIEVDMKGEPTSVASTVFHFNYSSGAASSYLLTNVALYDQNGAVIAGPVDATNVGGTEQKVTFTDTITYPIGKRTYTLKGKLPTGVTNGVTLTASTTPSTDWSNATGQVTGNSISFSSFSSAVTMNAMTVRTAALAIGLSTDPAAQTMVAGSQQRTFAKYQLDASQSGEDVRFSSISLTLGGSGTATNLTTCQLYDGATALNTGSNVVNPDSTSETFTLDNSLTITKGTVKTLDLKCNIVSGATGTFIWGVTPSDSNPSITGVTSGSDVNATPQTALTGQTMTMGSATLVASTDASSPGYTIASGGASGVVAGVIKFRASNQAVNLDRVGLKLTNTASSSAADVVLVTLWDGATQVGSAVFTGSNRNATSSLTQTVLLPKDADKTLTVKVNLADVGSSLPGGEGTLIAVDIDNNTNTRGTGVDSGTEIQATGSTAFSGIRVYNSYPVLASDSLPASGVADGRLMRFKVTADSANSISLYQFKFTLATTSATVASVNLFGFTDSSYSQPISGVGNGGQVMNSNQSPNGSGVVTITAQQTGGSATTIVVPAGATRWFEARGTVTGTATTYSVTTTLNGDSTASNGACSGTPSVCMTQQANTSGNFLWSPNATTTSGATDVDWTNGYGLPGLPSNGIIQTRSN